MTPAALSDVVATAVGDLVRRDGAPFPAPFPGPIPPVDLVRCRFPEHGDYTTAVALRLASITDLPARDLAAGLAVLLAQEPGVRTAHVAGPGFVNVTVQEPRPGDVLTRIVRNARPGPPAEQTSARRGSVRTSPADLRRLRHAVVTAALVRLRQSAGVPAPEDQPLPAVDRVGVVSVLPHVDADRDAPLADVDVDVLRFELARHPVGPPLVLDADALTRDAVANPGYAVRYAASRCAGLLRSAADLTAGTDLRIADPDVAAHDVLGSPAAARLVGLLSSYGDAVRTCATRAEPHRLARHLEGVADAVLALVAGADVLPRGDDETSDRHRALLLAVRASSVVLTDGLALLGLRAPVRL